jgi:hypothetical protein
MIGTGGQQAKQLFIAQGYGIVQDHSASSTVGSQHRPSIGMQHHRGCIISLFTTAHSLNKQW